MEKKLLGDTESGYHLYIAPERNSKDTTDNSFLSVPFERTLFL